ncbi:MAG: chorismate mutase [Acidimicrobiaceae bacterium]|nr:chorismate mutase [Acidimicrobiaceae bacterium]
MSAGAGDETLAGFRSSIDDIDASLVTLLGERFTITRQVGIHKARVGLPAADPEREAEQIVRLREVAASVGLDPSFSEKLLRLVFAEVRREHELARRDDATAADG